VNVHDANGVTPLMRAADRGKPDLIRLVLKAGASPAAQSATGRSAMDFANLKLDFFEKNRIGFKEGHADKRTKEFNEVCGLLANHDQ
jgi:ankyrin repeat protein